MKDRFEEISLEIESLEKQLEKLIPQIAVARRRAFSEGASKSDKEKLKKLELKGKEINDKIGNLINDAQELIGIPEEVFQEIDRIEIGGDSIESTKRELLTHDQFDPNYILEDYLPKSLDLLRSIVCNKWFDEEKTKVSGHLTPPSQNLRSVA